MGVKVTVNSIPKNRISINSQQKKTVRTVNVIPPSIFEQTNELRTLTDVDATDLDNNEVLVYDEATDKFVIKELPVLNGGTF